MIADNLQSVRQRIEHACRRAGRDTQEVTLVAVTKTVGVGEVRELARLGQLAFGENRAQEMQRKYAELGGQPFEWHMIGHLQRNKVRDVLRIASIIHSVDSERLAREIEKEAARLDRLVPVLIEVNVAGETAKYGVSRAELAALAQAIDRLPHVQLQGLMTMAPIVADAEEVRPVFAALRGLLDDLRGLGLASADLRHLSMGMTQDFEVAIEEGATMVRVGSALFR